MMAQVILSLCDLHMARDEQVPGIPWVVSLGQGPARPLVRTVDLCDDCAKTMRELHDLLDRYGRKSDAPMPSPSLAPSKQPDPHKCPACAYVAPNRSALSSHARNKHDTSLAELAGEPTPYECPARGCGRAFNRPQGVSIHVRRSHPELAAESAGAE